MPGLPIEELAADYPNPQPSGAIVFGDTIGYDASARIWVRQNWGDEWTENDQLVCTSVNWAASPTVPTATLVYRYGHTLERNGSTINVRTKLNLGGWYIRISVTCADGYRIWHGFVDDTGDEPSGLVSRATGGGPVLDATGKQTFSCVGMIAALDRSPIFNCYFQTNSTNQGPGLTTRRVANSAPHFNPKSKLSEEPSHQRQVRNRSSSTYTVPAFTPTVAPDYPSTLPSITRSTHLLYWENLYGLTTAASDYWSPRDIVKYLLAYHGPRDNEGKERIPVWLFEDAAVSDANRPLPTWGQPELDCDGLTLKQCLDRLMSQRSSLGYWAWVDDETNRLMIEPYTILESTITVATGKTVPANARLFPVTVTGDPATSWTVQRSESALANQIVIRGARRIAVCTLRINNGTTAIHPNLVSGWTNSDATDYITQFPVVSNDIRNEYARRDALEQGRFRSLYRSFTLGPSWEWKVQIGDVFGSATFADIFRNDDPDINTVYANDNSRYLPHPVNIRILDKLPLKEGIDYSTGTDATVSEHKNSTRQFRDIEVYGISHGSAWTLGSTGPVAGKPKLWTSPAKRDILYDVNDPDYSIEASPLSTDAGIGISLNVNGASQIVLGNQDDVYKPRLPPESLLCTVAIEEDRNVSQHWPTTAPDVDGILRKVFEFGESFQLVEILDGTTLGINNTGAFKRRGDRLFIRDDRPEMLELAKQLHRWYSTPRNVARITSRRATSKLWPGQMVTNLNPGGSNPHAATCNCVITEVSITFPIATPENPGKATFSVVTSRGEIDPLFFQPRLNA